MLHFKKTLLSPVFFFSFIFCVCFQTCRKALIFLSFVAAAVVVSLLMLFFPISEHPRWFCARPLEAAQQQDAMPEPLPCWVSGSTPRSFEAATSHSRRRITLFVSSGNYERLCEATSTGTIRAATPAGPGAQVVTGRALAVMVAMSEASSAHRPQMRATSPHRDPMGEDQQPPQTPCG